MACTITRKDIQSDIKDKIINQYNTGKPRKGAVFIPYNVENRESLYQDALNLTETLNSIYDSNNYGNSVTTEAIELGVDIQINPSQALADAMTVQNEMDEMKDKHGMDAYYMGDQALAEQEGGREFFSKYKFEKEATEKPVTDNYLDYLTFKESQLRDINIKLGEINAAKTNIKNDKPALEREGRRLGTLRVQVEGQIDDLRKNETDLMFHALIEDINNIDVALDNIEDTDLNALKDNLTFLYEFIEGKDFDDARIEIPRAKLRTLNNEAFDNIISDLSRVRSKYNDKLQDFAKKIVYENPTFKANILESGEYKEEDIEALFTAGTDITLFDKYLLGIGTSFADDTVLPQVISAEFKKFHTREFAFAELKVLKLRNFLAETNLKDFDFIYSKDKDGKKDGFITNVFSTAWFNRLQTFQSNYKKFFKEKNADTYRESVQWLEKNADVIDPSKLKVFKELYKDIYPEHFTAVDEVMDSYEVELRRKLGPKYDDYIERLASSLANFEALKQEQLDTDNRFRHKNIAERNVWEFAKAMGDRQNPTKEIHYTAGGQSMEATHFIDFDGLTFIPKETKEIRLLEGTDEVSTGFYSKTFKEIKEDPEKLEYWSLIKEMSEYINATYRTEFYGRMSYPKVKKDLAQKLGEAWQNSFRKESLEKTVNVLKGAKNTFKEVFYEKGRERKVEEVVANYADVTQQEIKDLAELYVQQGTEKAEALSMAKEVIFEQYSSDINKDIGSTMLLAAFHNARIKTAPAATTLESYYQTIKNERGGTRKKGIARVKSYKDRAIFNKTEAHRGMLGTVIGKDWTFLDTLFQKASKVPLLKLIVNEKSGSLLSDSEKQIFKELTTLKEEGFAKKSDFSFKREGIEYYKADDLYFKKVVGDEGTPDTTSEKDFTDNFEASIQEKITDLGLNVNLAGIIQAALKSIIVGGLALNPVSGAFNRIEGKHSGLIMDMTGSYWTTGNYSYADSILAFANVLKVVDKLAPRHIHKVNELRKIRSFAEILNTLQDRKNLLQRSAEDSKFEASNFNVYQFAVENPEYKNQMAIALSVAMDHTIKNKDGEEVKIFDGQGLATFDLVDGRLTLKKEFQTEENLKEWGNFDGDSVINLSLKITHAIDSSQGNFNPLDTIMATNQIYGRAAMIFMRWLPEHIFQRFSPGKGTDIITGKKRAKGRYTAALEGSPVATVAHFMSIIGLSYGIFGVGLIPPVGLGILSYVAYKKFFGKLANKEVIKKDTVPLMDMTHMLYSTLINTLNYPLDMTHVPGEYRLKNKAFNIEEGGKYHEKLTKEEAGALHALSKELAIMLTMLSIKLSILALFWDGDDDKDSEERMRYNFYQNQVNKAISSLAMYSNPLMFYSDMGRLALSGKLKELGKVVSMIWDEDNREKSTRVLTDAFLPTPGIIKKAYWKGQAPWEDTMVWQDLGDPARIADKPLRWIAEEYKDKESGGEYLARKKYTKLRKKISEKVREMYKDAGYEGDRLDKKVATHIKKAFTSKKPNRSYLKTYQKLEAQYEKRKDNY